MKQETTGAYTCPICGHNAPHAHSSEEMAERPHIDGARMAFEQAMNSHKLPYGLELAKALGLRSIPARQYPWGPYSEDIFERAWMIWKVAWMECAKAQAVMGNGSGHDIQTKEFPATDEYPGGTIAACVNHQSDVPQSDQLAQTQAALKGLYNAVIKSRSANDPLGMKSAMEEAGRWF